MDNLLNASCRVALAALMHDLGKFAQRADIAVTKEAKALHEQLYCPVRHQNGASYRTHKHAAYTALAFDELQQVLPDFRAGDVSPFVGTASSPDADPTNSLINAAAAHHDPRTFLQWVVATADRVASGFERENYDENAENPDDYCSTRLLSMLEEVSLGEKRSLTPETLKKAFPLSPLSSEALFPKDRAEVIPAGRKEAVADYAGLWRAYSDAIRAVNENAIPPSCRSSWPLALDALDTLWLTYTQSIPSATAFGAKPDVSLYDHSKATAALATALWRWHDENGECDEKAVAAMQRRTDWETKKFLLIQGDFFGIQEFIFSEGSETNKSAAKILRGRSFYVSLLCEAAALAVLDALSLPSTSQIINAAGKFMIVAPNTEAVRRAFEAVRAEINAWFVKNTFATAGIGLVCTEAACADFMEGERYQALSDRLWQAMERMKFSRYDLLNFGEPVLKADYSDGVCRWNGKLPADGRTLGGAESCALTRDQYLIGSSLTKCTHLLLLKDSVVVPSDEETRTGELPLFGYRFVLTSEKQARRLAQRHASGGDLRRLWDSKLPQTADEALWHGFARRNINGYVPRFSEMEIRAGLGMDNGEEAAAGQLKSFEAIARSAVDNGVGSVALMTVKGDVDNLGLIFQRGLTDEKAKRVMTFAKTASLSRQMNAFFAVYLPTLCAQSFPNVYTVFAGGDDFFLIAPRREAQRMVLTLNQAFRRFAAENPEVHFSVGLAMTKPGIPVRSIAGMAEGALESAKSEGKDRLTVFGETVMWRDVPNLMSFEDMLRNSADQYGVSSVYLYSLFEILEMAGDKTNPQASLWRSRLFYQTTRLFERQRKSSGKDTRIARDEFLKMLLQGMEYYGSAFRIPLSNVFYAIRQSK